MKKRIVSLIICIGMALAMLPQSASASYGPLLEIADWEGFRTAAATFTFDDGGNEYESHAQAAKYFDEYGYKATFYVVVNWMEGYWDKYKAFSDNGHDIGSHSVSHIPNASELAPSKTAIEMKIGRPCLTIAYPNCNYMGSIMSEYYLAGRNCNGTIIDKKTPSDFSNIPSIITGNTGINTVEGITGKMKDAIKSGGWAVFLTHGLSGYTSGSSFSPTSPSVLKDSLAWANKNDSDIWVTSMVNAVLYIMERNNYRAVCSGNTATSFTYQLTVNIDNKIARFDYPLSARVELPYGWTDADVTQKGAHIDSYIKDGKVYFSAVPNGGDIVIKKVDSLKKGDFDKDGEITVTDALAALRIAAKLAPETSEDIAIGDIDNDSHVTVTDALAILRVAAKLATSL